MAAELYGVGERVLNPRLSRIQASIETLKLSAAVSGSYSLSANQLGISSAIFVMHKNLFDSSSEVSKQKQWLHPDAYAVQDEIPKSLEAGNDMIGLSAEQLLDPSDFKTFLNPFVVAETNHKIVDWEYCLSFPGVRCMIKRPQGIQVNYLDERGGEHEDKLIDFSARVFLHELDHIEGRTMTHWKISEGNIDIIPGREDRNRHLMSTVEFYKEKIQQMKIEFEDELFSEQRPYDEVKDGEDVWKQFKQNTRKESIMDAMDLNKMVKETPAIEETMLLDTIRAMRRDRKEQAKKRAKSRNHNQDGQEQ